MTATIGDVSPAKAAQFAVPNFPLFGGQAVRGRQHVRGQSRDGSCWVAHSLQGLGAQSQSYDALQQAGFGITHLGTIAKGDGSRLSVEEMERAMIIFGWWLSVLTRSASTPCWWVGLGDDGQPLWTRHVAWIVDAWKGEGGLFPSGWLYVEHPEVLDDLTTSLERAFSRSWPMKTGRRR